MSRPWRLTRQAEASLIEIARWTHETFGPRQAAACEADLVARCTAIGADTVLSQDCRRLIDPGLPENLRFARAGEVLPERVSADGLKVLRDGDSGGPEATLSPLSCHYQRRAEIEAVVQGGDRDVAFDALCANVGAVIAADRTLGGLCDRVEAEISARIADKAA